MKFNNPYPRPSGELSIEEVFHGVHLALKNAEELLFDAETLASAGRPYRAIALAILALEEMGKIQRLYVLDQYVGHMTSWWQTFFHHPTKNGINNKIVLAELFGTGDEAFSTGYFLDHRKLEMLYVNFEGGRFVSPNDAKGVEDDVEALLGLAEESVRFHRFHLGGMSLEVFAQSLRPTPQ
jgi:AbiV family abortive infection protein